MRIGKAELVSSRFFSELNGHGLTRERHTLVKSDKALRSVARYVSNLALWLAGRDVNELESTRMKLDRELDEALEETFSASDPPSITREP
jgi:hypothetical protein